MILDVQLSTRFGFFNLTTEYYRHEECMFAFMRALDHSLWGQCSIKSAVLVTKRARIDVAESFEIFRERVVNGGRFDFVLEAFVRALDRIALATHADLDRHPLAWAPEYNYEAAAQGLGDV